MRRGWTLLIVVMLGVGLFAVPGCKKQMVTVESGEIVLCTYGEIVSDTTEEIEVPADEVAEHGVTTEVITCDLHEKLESLYAEAEAALAEGDTETAERVFAEIAETDGSYRDAASRLADLRAGGTAAVGGASGGGTTPGGTTPGGTAPGGATDPATPGGSTPSTPGDDGAPVGPIANLTTYIPDKLPGFVGQRIYSDPFVLFRDYLPESSGKVVQLAVEVEQFKDNDYARANVDDRVKTRYASDGEDLKIGSLDGYFGTRPGFAGLAFTEGPVFVLLEVYTTAANPAEHQDALVAAAKVMAGQ